MRKSKANRAFVTILSLNYRIFKAFKSDFRQKYQKKDMPKHVLFQYKSYKRCLFSLVSAEKTHLELPDIVSVFAGQNSSDDRHSKADSHAHSG